MVRAANLDFFAAEADQRALLDFLFASTDVRVEVLTPPLGGPGAARSRWRANQEVTRCRLSTSKFSASASDR